MSRVEKKYLANGYRHEPCAGTAIEDAVRGWEHRWRPAPG